MADDVHKEKIPALIPQNQFPGEALRASVQEQPADVNASPSNVFTLFLASAADAVTAWGRDPARRDRELRDFWPTEPYLAGAVANNAFRNAAYDWEIRGPSTAVEQALTDTLQAAIAGESFGWTAFVQKISQEGATQDNGFFVELIRDPSMDATSKFKDERAPVVGIAHLDSAQCTRTGRTDYPVVYTDRTGKAHKLAWYQVIPFSNFPSPLEKMNGVGYCCVTFALRLSQIMRSIFIYKDEKIGGRQAKQIHLVSGPSRMDIEDMKKRGNEEADNKGFVRFQEPLIIASMDPEKPVSVATINLASLPEDFNFDEEMKWYISGLALDFGVDYQEFAPLPGGGIGGANQSMILHRKSSGKGPAMFMKIAEAFKNYGVFPKGYSMVFEDRDEEKSLDKQTLRKLFQEEMALAIRNDFMDPERGRRIGIKRGLYSEADFEGLPKDYGLVPIRSGGKQDLGNTGGNTIAEDASRTGAEPPNNTVGDRLRKAREDENDGTPHPD